MKILSTLLAFAITCGAAAQTSAENADPLSRAGIKQRMEEIKKMDPQKVKQQADSICKLRKISLQDEAGKPLDIAKAIAANNILLMNGEVYYLPTGASTLKTFAPVTVSPVATKDPLKRDIQ
jgi:hypothetical protein